MIGLSIGWHASSEPMLDLKKHRYLPLYWSRNVFKSGKHALKNKAGSTSKWVNLNICATPRHTGKCFVERDTSVAAVFTLRAVFLVLVIHSMAFAGITMIFCHSQHLNIKTINLNSLRAFK